MFNNYLQHKNEHKQGLAFTLFFLFKPSACQRGWAISTAPRSSHRSAVPGQGCSSAAPTGPQPPPISPPHGTAEGSHPGARCFVFFNKVCNPMDTQNKTALRKQFHKLISVRGGEGEEGRKSLYKCITLPQLMRRGRGGHV